MRGLDEKEEDVLILSLCFITDGSEVPSECRQLRPDVKLPHLTLKTEEIGVNNLLLAHLLA